MIKRICHVRKPHKLYGFRVLHVASSQVVMEGINKGYLFNGENVGEFTVNYCGLILNSTKKFIEKTFFNNAWDYNGYRKQLNDQIWEATEGIWYNRSAYIASRIGCLDYFEE